MTPIHVFELLGDCHSFIYAKALLDLGQVDYNLSSWKSV